jgi:hypothetical protein
VLSLEGRPELVVPGVTQIRFDPTTGLSFAETLQQLLDRSPDVIHESRVPEAVIGVVEREPFMGNGQVVRLRRDRQAG